MEIGHYKMDADHREILVMIGDLGLEIARKSTLAIVMVKLDAIIKRIVEHFGYEESMMRKNKYNDYLNHKAEHQRLILEVQSLRSNLLSGSIIPSQSIGRSLMDWHLDHTRRYDLSLANELNESDINIKQ